MAPGDTLKGHRLPIVDGKPRMPEKPGEYVGPIMGYTGDKPAVFFLKPNARDPDAPDHARSVQMVTSPPHVFTEEDDGSLTIADSLSQFKRGWHGYLEHGVWREV